MAMRSSGLDTALAHGQKLPTFPSAAAARDALFRYRDDSVRRLVEFTSAPDCPFSADFTPQSLKTLEAWYFQMWESQSFEHLGITAATFEKLMAVYFGAVAVRNSSGFEWVVDEYAFTPGRYELGIRRGLVTITLMGFGDVWARRDNKKRQSIWREYVRFVS